MSSTNERDFEAVERKTRSVGRMNLRVLSRTVWCVGSLILLIGTLFFTTGCATSSPDENISERPWNTPQSWEHGLPYGITEDR